MFTAIKFQASSTPPSTLPQTLNQIKFTNLHNHHRLVSFRPERNPTFSSLSIQSDGNNLTSSVGSVVSPLPQQWNLTKRHVTVLNIAACVVAVATSWLFLSAIPALLAFKRAAESVEKLMDVMREELPDTMAAVRLSGMEISDLTMELSDLGQEITRGVRSSTQAVRVAEDRLRRLTNMVPKASVQEQVNLKIERVPVIAKSARGLREGIVKGRAFLQMFFSFTHFSRIAMNYMASRRRKA